MLPFEHSTAVNLKNEERLRKYEVYLKDLRSQIESKDNKIRSIEGRSSGLPGEKTKVSYIFKENKTRTDDCNVQISLLHQDNENKGSHE